ncbi:MAG: ComEC family competence protein [bacterium]|nr:ComEC family competence protein [bacterium]
MGNIRSKLNTRHSGIFIFIGSFVLGILLSSFLYISSYYALLLILIAISILLVEYINTRKFSKEAVLIALAILSLGLGILRYELKESHRINLTISEKIGEKITLEGLVTDEPERKDNVTRLTILPEGSEEKILVSADLYNKAQYGDKVSVTGKLQKPGIIKGDDGRDFDYGKYLSKDEIYYTISFARVEIVSVGHGNPIKSFLYKIKHKFIGEIRDLLPEPEASLLSGLILAGKESLPKNILEEFRRAGIVHIVVLSGYNITIVSEFFLHIFGFLSLQLAAISSLGAIILFTLMTGASATVVRAAIMVSVVLFGKILRRNYSAPRALLVAGFLMLLENPKILVFDASFKLSFLATLALIYVSPLGEKYLTFITEKAGLRSIISTTVSTQLVVLPYLMFSMGNFSVIALLANILVLVFIPVTMLLGFVATVFGFIGNLLALPFAYLAHLFLSWILLVSAKLGGLPWASIEVPVFSAWVALLWYAIYLAILWKLKQKESFFI